MRKGDIVKAKTPWTQKEAEQMGYKDPSEVPETFEVGETTTIVVCCTPIAIFKMVGQPFGFKQDDFEVVLPAGVPDVEKLLQESQVREMATMGF